MVLFDYQFILEVGRHGARAPTFIYDLAVDPSQNFQVPLELSQLGAEMHYSLGKDYVREKFFSEERPPSMSEIYVQSTGINRTC